MDATPPPHVRGPEGELSLAGVVEQFSLAGYDDDFRAEIGGLRASRARCLHQPEDLVVDQLRRFEGPSNPDDEATVFALTCPDGVRGTYVVPYGAGMPEADAEMVRRLEDRRRG